MHSIGELYLLSNTMNLLFVPFLVMLLACLHASTFQAFFHIWDLLEINIVPVQLASLFMACLATSYFMSQICKVYLVDFACYKPGSAYMHTKEMYLERLTLSGVFSEESFQFCKKVLFKSGLGEKTYIPESLIKIPYNVSMSEAKKEAEMMIFGAIDELFDKTKVKITDIGILVLNCTVFNPTPSFSAMVVNHYKLRTNILSYNLGGMGCSAGVISVDLAKRLLQMHPNTYALVVTTDNITAGAYGGSKRSMLVSNCLFRMGSAAILLSNHSSDRHSSKYELNHIIRSHFGANDNAYYSIYEQEDEIQKAGFVISKDLLNVSGEALNVHVNILGQLVLPASEKLKFLAKFVAKELLKLKIESYTPNFKLAFNHFCFHPGGRPILDAIQKFLGLSDCEMEASKMTLYRFGNTSSSSIWYELAYLEAKGRVKKGDKIWQLAMGGGFKCNSAVWKALRNIDPKKDKNAWTDEIHEFPVSTTF